MEFEISGYNQALVTAQLAVECLDASRRLWKIRIHKRRSMWTQLVVSDEPWASGRWKTYLTPVLWKGSRLDTSLGSTLERSASGMSAVGRRDVFTIWEAKARVSVLGRGLSWTCGRLRALSTRKENRGMWIGVLCPRDLVKREGASKYKVQWLKFCFFSKKKLERKSGTDRCIPEN